MIELSKNDVERWNLAASAWNTLNADSKALTRNTERIALPGISEFEAFDFGRGFYNPFVTRAANIELLGLGSEATFCKFFTMLAFLGLEPWHLTLLTFFLALHGGIHLSAWQFSFPTYCEKPLWRLSCFGLVLGFAPIALVAWVSLVKYRPILMCFVTTFTAVICVTSISSMYLILESFLSLRHEPVGVFAKLQWGAFLPSLG